MSSQEYLRGFSAKENFSDIENLKISCRFKKSLQRKKIDGITEFFPFEIRIRTNTVNISFSSEIFTTK